MASIDIFNPKRGWDEDFQMNTNWDYGSGFVPGANDALQRPRFGTWISRSIGNQGVTADLVFSGRALNQLYYIRRFYEQFRHGFFTLLDHDDYGSGDEWGSTPRNYVGRFTKFQSWELKKNAQYDIKVTFEEVPYAPMIHYPSDLNAYGHWQYACDDFLNPLVAASSSTAALATPPHPTRGGSGVQPPVTLGQYYMLQTSSVSGDFLQTEYVGFGFAMQFTQLLLLGVCNLLLDGVAIISGLDLSSGTATTVSSGVQLQLLSSQGVVLVRYMNVPLGRHQLMVQSTGAAGSDSRETGILFPAIQVIH